MVLSFGTISPTYGDILFSMWMNSCLFVVLKGGKSMRTLLEQNNRKRIRINVYQYLAITLPHWTAPFYQFLLCHLLHHVAERMSWERE